MNNRDTTRMWYSRQLVLAFLFLFGAGMALQAQTILHPPKYAPKLEFEENRGQVADVEGQPRPDILYTAESKNVKVFMSASTFSYVFQSIEGDMKAWKAGDGIMPEGVPAPILHTYRMDMEFVGANPFVRVERYGQTDGYRNFYLPHCPDGVLNARSFRTVVYRDLYRNIDVVMRAREDGSTKLDFVVHPGGNPSDIRIRPVGASTVEALPSGGVRLETPLGYLEEDVPFTYTTEGDLGAALPDSSVSDKQVVRSRWILHDGILTYQIGPYNRNSTVVIDPTRRWATYIGGSGTENVLGGDPTEVDRTGNAVIVGTCSNTSFPISTGGAANAVGTTALIFAMKLKYDNTRVWGVLYGGSGGGGVGDLAHGVVSDTARNVFVAGHSDRTNFPTTSGVYQTSYGGGQRDAIVIKFDSAGARQWATFFGGSQLDDGYGFAIDSSGNPALFLSTASTGLATIGQTTYGGGAYDAMIVKLTGASGGRIWATYLGGSNEDDAWNAASDNRNNIIVAGWTKGGFPTTTGASQTAYGGGNYDVFVTKYNVNGTKLWGTYLGGSGNENGGGLTGFGGLATDLTGNIFVTGYTTSTNFPLGSALQGTKSTGDDAFITKFDTSGVIQWSTYFGGAGTDHAHGCASNNSGSVLVVGTTTAAVPNLTPDAYQSTYGGGTGDVFLLKVNAAGNLVKYCTMYGGSGAEEGWGISFDPFGSIYFGGETGSNNFPVVGPTPTPVFQGTYAGSTDAFLCLLCDIEGGVIQKSGRDTMCFGDTLRLTVATGYKSYLWSTGDTSNSILAQKNVNANYWVTVTNHAGCTARSDTVFVRYRLRLAPQISPLPNPYVICEGDTVQLQVTATGAPVTYTWYDNVYTPRPTLIGAAPKVTDAGTYRVVVEDAYGCRDTSTVWTLQVAQKPLSLSIMPHGDTICQGTPLTLSSTRSMAPGEVFTWNSGGSGTSINVTTSGQYYITVRNGPCLLRSDTVFVKVNPKPQPTISGQTVFCEGDTVQFQVLQNFKSYQWSTRPSDTTKRIRVWQGGPLTVTVTDTNGCIGQQTVNVQMVQHPKPTVRALGNPVICQGDSVVLETQQNFSSWEWSTGAVGTYQIVVKDSGYYYVKVRSLDAAGCPGQSDTIHVIVRPKPSASLSGPIAVCVNSTSPYKAPPAAGITYSWTVAGAGGSILSGQGTDSISVKWGATPGTGTVRIRATDPLTGCFRDTTLSVNVGSGLKPNVNPGTNISICPGDSVTLNVGGGYTQYTWTNAGTGQNLGSTQSIVVNTAGSYLVAVRDANNCSGSSDTIKVRIATPPSPAITVVQGRTMICPGGSLTLDAGPYAGYKWAGGQTLRQLQISDSGTYSVTVTDASGCKGTAQIVITRATPPSPVITGPTSVCINTNSQYSVVGGSPSHGYNWTVNGPGTITAGQGTTSITVNWTGSGAATVEVADTDRVTTCFGIATPYPVSVGTSLTPTIQTSGNKTIFCDGDTITLRAPGYITYTWKDAGGTTIGTDDTLRVWNTGTYTVDVSDGTCSGTTSLSVTRKPPVSVTVTPPTAQICQGDSVTLTASPGFSKYNWTTGDTTQTITVKQSGNYSVNVFDADGCSAASLQSQVTVNPKPVANVVQAGDTLTAFPGGLIYQWLNNNIPIAGATLQTYIAKTDGNYRVIVTGPGGCKDTTVVVPVSGAASATIGMGKFQGPPGQVITVPLELRAAGQLGRYGLKTYTAKIRFDRSLLIPLQPNGTSAIIGKDRVFTVTGTLATNTVTGTTPVIIVPLQFKVALGNVMTTPLTIESFTFAEGGAALTLENGEFTLTGLCETGGRRLVDASGSAGLKSVRPNPAHTTATISYEVVEDGLVSLSLVNTAGQTIPVWSGATVHGRYDLDMDASILAAGTYRLVLESAGRRWSMPVQIQK